MLRGWQAKGGAGTTPIVSVTMGTVATMGMGTSAGAGRIMSTSTVRMIMVRPTAVRTTEM